MDCLTNIVGVTKDDKECITGGLTSAEILALQKSTSGLYLEDLPGGVTLKALRYVDTSRNMAQMSLGAINNAIKVTEDDLKLSLSSRYQGNRTAYQGTIGRMSYAQTLNVTENFQGMLIKPVGMSDGVIRVSRFHVIINQTETFNLQIYRSVVGSQVAEFMIEYEVVASANQYANVTLPSELVLPLMENGRAIEYYVVYDRSTANNAMPKDTDLGCSTCEASTKAGLHEFVTIHGVQLASMGNINSKSLDTYSHGIIMDVTVKCESERLICREYDEEEAVSIALSYAVWYKAGELLIEDVIKQPDINRYTTMDREYLWGKRNHFKKEYNDRIAFISATIDVTQSNCYVCRETANQPFFGPILS